MYEIFIYTCKKYFILILQIQKSTYISTNWAEIHKHISIYLKGYAEFAKVFLDNSPFGSKVSCPK